MPFGQLAQLVRALRSHRRGQRPLLPIKEILEKLGQMFRPIDKLMAENRDPDFSLKTKPRCENVGTQLVRALRSHLPRRSPERSKVCLKRVEGRRRVEEVAGSSPVSSTRKFISENKIIWGLLK